VGNGTHILLALAEKVKEDRIVCFDGSIATQIFNENIKKNYPCYFSTSVNVGDQVGHILKFIKNTMHKGEGKPKVALLYIDDAAGRDPLPIVDMLAKRFGVDLVLVEPVPMTVTDFATHMIKIRNSKADYAIFVSWVIPATTRFAKSSKTYIPNVKLFGINFSAYEILFETAGESYDNFYATTFYPKPFETDNPLVKLLLNTIEKKGRKIKIWDGYLRHWLSVTLCAELARRADNAGNLTREGVLIALEKMDDWTAHGLYGGKPLHFHNQSLSIERIVRADFKAQRFVPVTDWVNVSDYLK
jgi:branched-chain amino acid transport system substrate-binding protein